MRGFFVGLGFSLAFIVGALWARDVEPPAHAASPPGAVESMCVSADMAKVKLTAASNDLTRKGGWNQALERYADGGWEPVQFIHDRDTIAAVCFKRINRGERYREPQPVVEVQPPPRAAEPPPKVERGGRASTPPPAARAPEPEPARVAEPAPSPEPPPAIPADTCEADCRHFGELAGATDMIRKVVADKCLVRCSAGDERYQACVRVARGSGDVQRCNAME
ncbi:MAG: hypothetical protein H6744_03510 [Deltaproteobacteria bacterium]|nr:hypothetical protein [Deltaproteobacteria bacterium]MCB9785744.1 hypothetical protein [Deltaproteobacteria bacterium]